jgi:hypothetical protein
MGLLAILQLINAAAPIATNIILAVKHKDGSVTTVVLLDEADAQYAKNIADAQAWLASHGKPTA